MTRVEAWAREAYYNAGNDYPWELLNSRDQSPWVRLITDAIIDRIEDRDG